jgi:hypothetical protein
MPSCGLIASHDTAMTSAGSRDRSTQLRSRAAPSRCSVSFVWGSTPLLEIAPVQPSGNRYRNA